MMGIRKGRELIGLSVMDSSSGRLLGEVRDLLYDPAKNKLVGFVIADHGWLWGAKLLIYDQVHSVGTDVVFVDGEKTIHNTRNHPDYKKVYQDRIDIRGYLLLTGNGEVVGTIKDVLVDPEGNLVGYEVSDGVVHDLLSGRKTVPTANNMVISEDTVIFNDASV